MGTTEKASVIDSAPVMSHGGTWGPGWEVTSSRADSVPHWEPDMTELRREAGMPTSYSDTRTLIRDMHERDHPYDRR